MYNIHTCISYIELIDILLYLYMYKSFRISLPLRLWTWTWSCNRIRKNTSEKMRRRSHGVKKGDSWSTGIFPDGWWKLPCFGMWDMNVYHTHKTSVKIRYELVTSYYCWWKKSGPFNRYIDSLRKKKKKWSQRGRRRNSRTFCAVGLLQVASVASIR